MVVDGGTSYATNVRDQQDPLDITLIRMTKVRKCEIRQNAYAQLEVKNVDNWMEHHFLKGPSWTINHQPVIIFKPDPCRPITVPARICLRCTCSTCGGTKQD